MRAWIKSVLSVLARWTREWLMLGWTWQRYGYLLSRLLVKAEKATCGCDFAISQRAAMVFLTMPVPSEVMHVVWPIIDWSIHVRTNAFHTLQSSSSTCVCWTFNQITVKLHVHVLCSNLEATLKCHCLVSSIVFWHTTNGLKYLVISASLCTCIPLTFSFCLVFQKQCG